MIDPAAISTIRVGELPPEPFSLTDLIPHEVGTDLRSGTIEDLSVFIRSYIGASNGVGFRAISVIDGQTLPTTNIQEFILVGKGTYYNVAGGSTIICTEELNAIVSNGSFWFIGVEIPINVELAGITQTIRNGFTNTTPSEDAIFDALATKEPSFTKNTAFNKNFGTTAGTVVEGGTLGSNAYTSTAYLPVSNPFAIDRVSVMGNGSDIMGQGSHFNLQAVSGTSYQYFLQLNSVGGVDQWLYNGSGFSKVSTLSTTGNISFTGKITAAPAVNSNEVVVKSQLDAAAGRPYKVYTALLTQSGNNAPVATVLENTLGGTVVWSKISAGKYLGTLTGAFTGDKTISFFQTRFSNAGSTYTYDSGKDSNNSVRLYALLNGSYSDQITVGQIEIRVYN